MQSQGLEPCLEPPKATAQLFSQLCRSSCRSWGLPESPTSEQSLGPGESIRFSTCVTALGQWLWTGCCSRISAEWSSYHQHLPRAISPALGSRHHVILPGEKNQNKFWFWFCCFLSPSLPLSFFFLFFFIFTFFGGDRVLLCRQGYP